MHQQTEEMNLWEYLGSFKDDGLSENIKGIIGFILMMGFFFIILPVYIVAPLVNYYDLPDAIYGVIYVALWFIFWRAGKTIRITKKR